MGRGRKGTSPWWAGVPPLGPPPAPRVGNPRVGAPPLALGGTPPPLAAAPLGDPISRAGAPQGAYIKEGGGRAAAPQALAPPSPLLHLSLS